jgi:cellulose synthase/poly-beta-1,6-N-acetylglucosamine synthase-like glycosyltransferase
VYTYLGYPLILWIVASLSTKTVRKSPFFPHLTILVVANNEESNIDAKIRNLLDLDYPAEKKKIVVVSDASIDLTDKMIDSFAEDGVLKVRMEERVGKAGILNRIIPSLDDEFIVLSDSRQIWNRDSLKMLMANFSDDSVGVVSGELVFRDAETTQFAKGVGFYWRYEKFLRKREAMFDSTCGVTGCIYALRKSFFRPFPNDTILDDFVIPMNIVKHGKRVIFQEGAIALDYPSSEASQETKRKIRTLSGNYQAYFRMGWMFNPIRNRLFFQLVSHKLLRLLVPYFMVVLLITNALILDGSYYTGTFVLQCSLYGMMLLSLIYEAPLFGIMKAFIVLNYNAFMALPIYLSGRQKATWK